MLAVLQSYVAGNLLPKLRVQTLPGADVDQSTRDEKGVAEVRTLHVGGLRDGGCAAWRNSQRVHG